MVNVLATATAAEALLSKLVALEPEIEGGIKLAGIAFNMIAPAVVAAEGTAMSGDDKLQHVLQNLEVQWSKLPSLNVNFGELANDVAKVINELVADYKAAKLFVSGVKHALTGH